MTTLFSTASTTFECLLCLEDVLLSSTNHECRQCKIKICDSCMHKHMKAIVEKAAKKFQQLGVHDRPTVWCPHCRLEPWHAPKFFKEVVGREIDMVTPIEKNGELGDPYIDPVSIRIKMALRPERYIHGIHDGVKYIGYACLKHTPEFDPFKQSFHVKDIDKLEPFAKDLHDLVFDIRNLPASVLVNAETHEETVVRCIVSTEDDADHLKASFDKAGTDYVEVNDCTYFVDNFDKFIKSSVNPF